jgi:hypothetical protein
VIPWCFQVLGSQKRKTNVGYPDVRICGASSEDPWDIVSGIVGLVLAVVAVDMRMRQVYYSGRHSRVAVTNDKLEWLLWS